MSDIFDSLVRQIRGKNLKIVFPEGEERRILGAAARLKRDNILIPLLLGNKDVIEKVAAENELDISDIEIIQPENYPKKYEFAYKLAERRKGKVTEEEALKLIEDVNYLGTMLTYLGVVDGMVSGSVHSTGETVRPALQIVKTKPGISRTSGAMIMLGNLGERYLFADVAINITLDAHQAAEVAIESAKTATLFGIDPKVAMLSFSTYGSAKSEQSRITREATLIAREMAPDLIIDGELQFDAAIVPSVAKQKAPGSPVAGQATVFIFPDLQSGNIGYKIAQRLGGYEAIGPILQGLNKPISDLSRGCNEEDVYKLSIITAAQSLLD